MTEVETELQKLANPDKAKTLRRFFKTGKGEYGEGDRFLGITVPEQRKIAIRFEHLELAEIDNLLKSPIHEHRLTALLILVQKFKKQPNQSLFDFYLSRLRYVNNWDLVDLSAPKILGSYLYDKDRAILYQLATSDLLWERRTAIIATLYFVNNFDYSDSLRISKLLLKDNHDLIHKAVGWVLREIGKRDIKIEEDFLNKHHQEMPRTMLRYAIERFSTDKREFYLKL